MALCHHAEPGWPVVCDKPAGHLGQCSGLHRPSDSPYSNRHTWASEFDWRDLVAWGQSDFSATLENVNAPRAVRVQAGEFHNALNHNQGATYRDGKPMLQTLANLVLEGYKLRQRKTQWFMRLAWQDGSRIEELEWLLHSRKEVEIVQALEAALQSRWSAMIVSEPNL